jgi:hypothetical protein
MFSVLKEILYRRDVDLSGGQQLATARSVGYVYHLMEKYNELHQRQRWI